MNLSEYRNNLEKTYSICVTYKHLASILGVTKQYISQIKNAELSENHLQKLEKHFKSIYEKTDGDVFEIPVRENIKASLGYGVTLYDEAQTATYLLSSQLMRDLGLNPHKTEMIFAKGDSMEPTICGGDSLLVDLSKKDYYEGAIYCIRLDNQLYVKRLQKIAKNKIMIISDNIAKYRPRELVLNEDSDFEVIGEVRWWGRVAK